MVMWIILRFSRSLNINAGFFLLIKFDGNEIIKSLNLGIDIIVILHCVSKMKPSGHGPSIQELEIDKKISCFRSKNESYSTHPSTNQKFN